MKKLKPLGVHRAVVSVLGTISICGSVSAGVPYRTVALSGEAAPGAGGLIYTGFGERPSLNNAGDVAFIAGLQDLSEQGTSALFGPTDGAGSALGRLFAVGDAAPGFGDGTTLFDFERGVTLNAFGDVAFLAELNPDSPLGLAAHAVFGPSAGPGSPTTVIARRDDPNLGFNGSINFLNRSGSQPTISDAGDIAFIATLGPLVTQTLYGPASGGAGHVQLTSENDMPPAAPLDRRYQQLLQVLTILDTGEVAYEALLEYPSPGSTLRRNIETFIYAASEQGVRQLGPPSRSGDPVPGRNDGAVFNSGTSAEAVNARGDVLLRGSMTNGSGQIIRGWFGPTDGPGSEIDLVLQTHIPRTFDGKEMEITGAGVASLNNNGDFAFIGSFIEDGQDAAFPPAFDLALFVQIDGQLELIAKEGDLFDAAPDAAEDLRRIVGMQITPDGFNDEGEVLFELDFEDGSSGLFVATVPEPSAAIVFAGFALGLFVRRRRAI